MKRYLLLPVTCMLLFTACVTRHASQSEAALLPEADKGKWWIIHTILQDMHGKDLHFNALVSTDRTGDKNYASCFAAAWSQYDSGYYTASRTSEVGAIRYKSNFPVRIYFPPKDSGTMEWSLLLKRNGVQLLTSLSRKETETGSYTQLKSAFRKQDPFSISVISLQPQARALKPVNAESKIAGSLHAGGKEKLFIRVFSDKELLLKMSASACVHWLDLSLQSGKQLGILFTTDAVKGITTHAVLLWDEQGNIMAKPTLILEQQQNKTTGPDSLSRPYPLIFSIVLPEQQLNIQLQPRMTSQEIKANKNSFWMGAMEARETNSGLPAGKGNMYIFKQ